MASIVATACAVSNKAKLTTPQQLRMLCASVVLDTILMAGLFALAGYGYGRDFISPNAVTACFVLGGLEALVALPLLAMTLCYKEKGNNGKIRKTPWQVACSGKE